MNTACNCNALRQASRRIAQLYDRALAPAQLKTTQYSMLSQIERLGPISLIPLADKMVMDRATLGHNLRPLEARGYVTLSVGTDRRVREVSLTPTGRKVLAKAKPLWNKAQMVFEGELGPEEAAKLRLQLQRVAETEFESV